MRVHKLVFSCIFSLGGLVWGQDGVGPSPWPLTADGGQIPGERCWPSQATWAAFNSSIGGRLIQTIPMAAACYDGPHKDAQHCAYVAKTWPEHYFQTSQPLGRWYPFNLTCPPIDASAARPSTSCSLGQLLPYAVNITTPRDIREALAFARKHSIRVSILNTGHDLNGRADGFGSLSLWLRHMRRKVTFEDVFASRCDKSGWDGSAIHIDGAYQWGDVHKVAKGNGVIVVGGGSSSPGATGGWLSGGGHGPASRNYGLGADQLLEAQVMLANGTVVTADRCRHTDLFRALRGGGPGYGIVLSTKIKAHPNVDVVTSHGLTVTPRDKDADNGRYLDAVSTMMQSHPGLVDSGFAGYVVWFPRRYNHSLWTIGKSRAEADAAFASVRAKLAAFNESLLITESFREYGDYWSFYESELDRSDTPGDTLLLTSRFIDKESPDGSDKSLLMLVSGGKVFEDAADKTSGLHPAWRRSPMVLISSSRVPRYASPETRNALAEYVTSVKGAAAKKLAPNTGGYMNEGDGGDPDYISTFYGANYASHLAAKDAYDPKHVFYCPTCVGAERFVDRPDGALCRVSSQGSS
ncbi:hypothetical protein HIM_09246 [Hirsutella minnesotensis 3608]|uniref:FAD-binding PCMH-type domain-containing protein n=1 Tax=Hirsutella minnesotensis 3608 TaxID=1043627 RepID=A0A0F7ZSH3_9HYPO|nr:hypothetical protein HIM_09246 [Hirsutella minnesotensis 3608]